ncbi:MAG: (2Fe-2S)-binding protein [Gammaproteobacteria bacterium]|nr:(2Fe-2S)-binding protein [Gammaproteobacteria bacterium]
MIVCVCKNVSDRQIRAAMADGATTVRALRNELAVSTCCGKCAPEVKRMVDNQDMTLAAQVVSNAQDTVRGAGERVGVKLRSSLYQPAQI